MFSPNVVTLKQFYASPFGEATRQLVESAIAQLWPAIKDDSVLGIGFATPYLENYVKLGCPVAACMPASQGAAYWPPSRGNLVMLAHASDLPLRENSFNRVLLIHSLENSDHLSWMMEEIWRVLTPGGRVLAIVPNRLGLWARAAHSPFGYGRTFSLAQLRDLLSEHNFTLGDSRPALFIPPTHRQFLWRFARKFEAFGRMFCPFIGGVWLVEAEKQVYASIKQPVMRRSPYAVRGAAAQTAMSANKTSG